MRGNEYNLPAESESALECYMKAIEIDPDYPPAWNRMGRLCELLCLEEEARMCFEKERIARKKLGIPVEQDTRS